MAILILIEMLFLHVFADYQLQGILANMKQKEWWIKQTSNVVEINKSQYKNDYKAALVAHSLEWSFVVLFPMFYHATKLPIDSIILYVTLLIWNTDFHYMVDDSKANKKMLNLVEDQIMHLGQILVSWLLWTVLIGWR